MKTEQHGVVTSVLAAANLSKHKFVRAAGDHAVVNEKALGVTPIDTDSGQYAPVVTTGIALVLSGAAVAIDTAVTSNADGKAIGAGANPVNGYTMDAASGADELIRIKLA